MSLISEFHLGDPERILARHRNGTDQATGTGVERTLSLSTKGFRNSSWLFVTDLELLADVLARRDGQPEEGLKRYVEAYLEGDEGHDCEAQVLLLRRTFAEDMQSLAASEIKEFERRLDQQELESEIASNRRRRELARRPIQTGWDLLAFPLVAAVAWSKTSSWFWVGVWSAAMLVTAVFILPRLRLRRIPRTTASIPPSRAPRCREELRKLIEFCTAASRSEGRVVYEWSV